MTLGVFFAALFTVAKIMGSADKGHSSSNMVLGAAWPLNIRKMSSKELKRAAFQSCFHVSQVVICILSLLCGSLNLALAGVLGEMKLSARSPKDT